MPRIRLHTPSKVHTQITTKVPATQQRELKTMELTADQAKQGAGKKRKLKRRERNHAKREQKAVEIHSSDPSVPLSPAKLHSGLERPATAASDLSDDDLATVSYTHLRAHETDS